MYDISRVTEIGEQIVYHSYNDYYVDGDVFQIIKTNLQDYIMNNHEYEVWELVFAQMHYKLKGL